MVWKYFEAYEEMQWGTYKDIESYQYSQLKKILDYAAIHCPFYRKRMEEYGVSVSSVKSLSDLSKLPDITKADLVGNYSAIKSSQRRIFTSTKTTGGSTGQAVTIDKNADALARERAATWRAYKWAGVGIGDVQARFWGTPLSTKALFLSKVVDFVSNRSRISAFNINEKSLDEYYFRLIKMKPVYLYGYVSMIVAFAEHIIMKGYSGVPSLKSIITTSEVLGSSSRNIIEEAFGVRVFNEYGCGEVGSIAHECEYGSMHVMAENVIIEVDKKNSPDGESGELIVTDLHNYAMPLIRYRIGDYATLSEGRCECGRGLPIIRQVHGRAYDMICDPDGNRYHPEIFMYIFEGLKRRNSGIRQFQVVQKSAENLVINIVPEEYYNSSVEGDITQSIRKKVHAGFKIDFKYMDDIVREASGKMRVIKSELDKLR